VLLDRRGGGGMQAAALLGADREGSGR
jgi:hypothetical protein